MDVLVPLLALVVAAQYAVIAAFVVPRLAGLVHIQSRLLLAARWGAVAFFAGCAVTHLSIALASLHPSTMSGMHANGDTGTVLLEMVVPHVAQIVGGVLFIGIVRTKLEVSIVSKQTAAETRGVDRQFKVAFDRAPLGIALLPLSGVADPSSYVNPAFRGLFGQGDLGSADGLPVSASSVHRDDRVAVEAAMTSMIDDEPVVQELRVSRRDGQTRRVLATLSAVVAESGGSPLRMTGVFEDITDRRRADQAVHDSEQKFRDLADGLGIGVVLRQLKPSQFLYANAEYVRIVGYNPTVEEPADMDTVLSRIHPDDMERFLAGYWAATMAGEQATTELRVLGLGGATQWLRATTTPQEPRPGLPARTIDTIEDITDFKVAEASVISARLEAERANLAKSEFLSRMSHELRTPLNAVLGFGQLLQMDVLSPSQDDSVECILGGGRHLLGMIDDILDIARIESNQLEVSLGPVKVAEILGEVANLMGPIAASADIELRVLGAGPEVSPHVHADKRRLRQILINLVSNAIKYNEPGGTVDLACSMHDSAQVEIAVIDTGLGIREEDLSRLFTPFDRLGQQTTEIEGTGIGLALSLRLAAIMGGRIEVTSVIGQGSTFTVSMPSARAIECREGTMPPPPITPPSPEVEHSTLLYIEDNLPNVRLMQAILNHRPGWELVHAGHGTLGLELATNLQPTLIMLDLHLPDMHGIDVLRALRDNVNTAAIPIIVVSADANHDQIHRLKDAGADHYLTKPLDIAAAMALLDKHANLARTG